MLCGKTKKNLSPRRHGATKEHKRASGIRRVRCVVSGTPRARDTSPACSCCCRFSCSAGHGRGPPMPPGSAGVLARIRVPTVSDWRTQMRGDKGKKEDAIQFGGISRKSGAVMSDTGELNRVLFLPRPLSSFATWKASTGALECKWSIQIPASMRVERLCIGGKQAPVVAAVLASEGGYPERVDFYNPITGLSVSSASL